jgi:hypothetical protein
VTKPSTHGYWGHLRSIIGHNIEVKALIQQKDRTIVNRYIPNTGASRYIEQTLRDLKRDLE